ncbi:MAG: alpha/beta hydrolase [bacterium]|nr:alpha/beta hydrolase [bacterium]
MSRYVKRVIPQLVSVVSRVAPGLGARLAWYLWVHPHGRRNAEYPDGADLFRLEVFGHEMVGFTVGDGAPVLLLHGWGGASTDMAPLALATADAGYMAVVPELPGHGSDRSSYTDVFRMAATVDAAVGLFGDMHAVVAHSFGAVVAFAAFQHGGPDRVILVAPAVKGAWFLDSFRSHVDLSEKAYRKFRARFEAFAGPYLMDVLAGKGDVADADMLILHDPDDERTPYVDSAAYAQRRPNTALIDVAGSGHKGILSDPLAMAEVVKFIG